MNRRNILMLRFCIILLSAIIIGMGMGGCVFFDIFNGLEEDDDKEDAPYLIKNIEDLQNIKEDLAGNYALANDIDASETETWNDGKGFMPIGNYENPFTGSFDGRGYEIMGLQIERPETVSVGLFGFVEDEEALIQNIGIIAAYVEGVSNVGGLIGSLYNGEVSSSYVTGKINGVTEFSATSALAGGLVGRFEEGKISNSYSEADVFGGSRCVGGLIGRNYNGKVANSYATGTVTGDTTYVAGLIGQNYYGVITGCYATGDVHGDRNVGGLVGRDYNGATSNSYATGNVIGTGNGIGGLFGVLNGTVENSYAEGNVTGEYNVGGFAGVNGGSETTIKRSYATGNVSGNEYNIGGLVGKNTGSISDSYALGSVEGGDSAGGLVGHNRYFIEHDFGA